MSEWCIFCPCCKKTLKMNLHQFGEHYQDCLKALDELESRKDLINQARIELNAAVTKYNEFVKSIGYEETASILYDGHGKGDFWDDMFNFIASPRC